jgi:alpha-N-arabinofuranosidase
MPTFGAWERTVLEHAYEAVDYVSCHAYYEESADGDVDSFLASAEDMERFIDGVVATCDHVRATTRATKRMEISFDEWNVWYLNRPANPEPPPWSQAPRLLEDVYTVTDAVVVGSLLITLLRRCDRVTAACLAQLVNVIAPIMTETGGPAWRQTTFHPFASASRYGEVPLLHATAVRAEDGAVTVFAVNRDTARPLRLTADLRGFGPLALGEHSALWDDDRHATNTRERPDRVVPRVRNDAEIVDGRLAASLPPLSWNVIRLLPSRSG